MKKIKIYVLHYSCGTGELITCYSQACDLCSKHEKLYYEEKEVSSNELFNIINDSKLGNYIHISTVKPEGWISQEEYEYYNL